MAVMRMQNVHTTLAQTSRWKLRRWPNDPSVAHLIFTDIHVTPGLADFRAAMRQAAARGVTTMRTSALFPAGQDVAVDAGFVPIDRLALLSRSLDADDDPLGDRAFPMAEPRQRQHRVRPMRRWHLVAAAETDGRAFGPLWANTPASLHEIFTATQAVRARCVRREESGPRSPIGGFLISGISDRTGYVQRLSVDPRCQRRGIGRLLLNDALGWMRRARVRTVFVNTGVENFAALELYRSAGFVDTGEVLSISEALCVSSGTTDG